MGGVVGNAKRRAQGLQHLVLLRRHVILRREGGIALVVIRPASQNHGAAGLIEPDNGRNLVVRIGGVGVPQSRPVPAGGGGENQHLVLAVAAGGNEIFPGFQLHGAQGVPGSQVAEVAHRVFVVAGHILVVVGGVNAHIQKLFGVQYIQLHVHGEFILHALQLHAHGHGDGHDLGGSGRVGKGDGLGAGGGHRITGGIGAQDHGAIGGVRHIGDLGVCGLAVEQGGGELQLLAGDRGGGPACHAGDPQLQGLAHPYGSRDGQVAVALGDADVIVAVGRLQGAGKLPGGQDGGIVPGVGHLTGVHNDLHLGDGVRSVRIGDLYIQLQGLGGLLDDRAQRQAVDRVIQLQVLVLSGIDPQIPDGLVEALLREVVGEDDVPGVVGIAPAALVVVLVIGGGHMPALIQSQGVLLIAGVVAAGSDGPFAVAHLHQEDAAVDEGVPIAEVGEIAEGGARVVELADGVRPLRLAQEAVIGLHTGIRRFVVQSGVVPGDNAGGVPGVDVAGAAGPGHLKAAQGNDVGVGGIKVRYLALELGPEILAVSGSQAHVVEGPLRVGFAGLVKVVGVVRKGHKIDVGALRQVCNILQRCIQAAGAVGISGVGVKLAKIQLLCSHAHSEGPGLGGSFAICPGDRDGDAGAALCQVLQRGIGDRSIGIDRIHSSPGHGHLHPGVLSGVGNGSGDDRALVLPGLASGGGSEACNHRLILHRDVGRGSKRHISGIRPRYHHLEALPCHGGGGDFQGIDPCCLGAGQVRPVQGSPKLLNAKDCVHGKGQGIGLAHIGIGESAKLHRRFIDHTASEPGVGAGIEVEGVDVLVRHIVHAVGLIGPGVVLQILGVLAVELGGAALHGVAAVVRRQSPVGVLVGLLLVKGVVPCAIGAEIAEGLVDKAVIGPVFLHGEHQAPVGRRGGALCHCGGGVVQRGAFRVAVLGGQNALGRLVENHNRIPGSGQAAFPSGLLIGELVEVKAVIVVVLL